ncbi:MinD/ParA family ATP-binding protein, partial [Nocardioides panacihumi]
MKQATHHDIADGEVTRQVPEEPPRWRRTPQTEVLGPLQNSGLRDPSYLVRRWDDQMVQLSELLYLALIYVEPTRSSAEVAELVSAADGRILNAAGLDYLVETRLQPLGLVEPVSGGGAVVRAPRANPLLALSVKGTIVPPAWSRRLGEWLRPMFWPPVVVVGLIALVALDVVIVRQADFSGALLELFLHPTLALVMYAIVTLAGLIHEVGHATACRYGGARPGAIGVGLYLVFPAFYTDVTDSYRLSRGGRVRTDLGGLYFHAWCVVALSLVYLQSGAGIIVLCVLLIQIQMVQQLIPIVRFDGYYVLADLAGIPDLFSRVGPVLRSLRPGEEPDRRVLELKPAARRLVTGWVVVVVPLLTLLVGWLLWTIPDLVHSARIGLAAQQDAFAAAWAARDLANMALSVISVFLILLPLVGVAIVVWRLAVSVGRVLRAGVRRAGARRAAAEPTYDPDGEDLGIAPDVAAAVAAVPAHRAPSAADFTDENMLDDRAPAPATGWRKVVYEGTGHTLNPGLSAAERRRAELEARLRTPILGSRRVVVMSRKGGVGKTTTTLALGSIFAMLRGDRVVAVDANPDAGNLAHRLAPPSSRKITDLLQEVDRIDSYSVLREFTSQAVESRLEVLASDDDPRIGQALGREEYHSLITLLDHFYNLILLDTGTGIL